VTFAGYLPLLLQVLVSLTARRTSELVAPRVAVRWLVAAAVLSAAASVWSLTMLALTLFDDLPPLSALDERPELGLPEPVPGPVALCAALALAAGVLLLVRDLYRRGDTTRRLRAAGRPRTASSSPTGRHRSPSPSRGGPVICW
jgi:hypothetical protein